MALDAILVGCVFKAADVHLCADAVDVGCAVSLPLLDPVDERLQLLIVIPVGLKVVVVDEKHDVLRAVFASQPTGLTHVFQVAHVVLPVERTASHVPCATVIALRVL